MTTFQLSPEEFARQYADDGILKNGLVMDDMEGIWLAWATDPAAVQAMLPPAVEFAAPRGAELYRESRHQVCR